MVWIGDSNSGLGVQPPIMFCWSWPGARTSRRTIASCRTGQSPLRRSGLSTVGRAIRHLKDGGVIAEIRSEPRLRRLGIRTYCLLIGHDATGQNDRPDRSKCALSTRHFDRENPEKTKRNRRESGDGRKSRKGREAFQIGELIITTMD